MHVLKHTAERLNLMNLHGLDAGQKVDQNDVYYILGLVLAMSRAAHLYLYVLIVLFMVTFLGQTEILFFLSGCLFGSERHIQSSTVTNPGQEEQHRPVFPGTAYHAGPEGDSSEGTRHLREETQRLCIQQPGSFYMCFDL